MESSRFYYYFIKVGGAVLVSLCGYALITTVFFPTELRSDVPLEPAARAFIVIGYATLGLAMAFATWRMAFVKFHCGHLEVVRHGTHTEVPWCKVEDVFKIPCTTPPMYWIRMIDRPGVMVIPWSWFVVSIGFWSWDFTRCSAAIERHRPSAIRELNRV